MVSDRYTPTKFTRHYGTALSRLQHRQRLRGTSTPATHDDGGTGFGFDIVCG